MKVFCIETTSKKFDLEEVKSVVTHDHNYGGRYGLEVGKEYLVLGIIQDRSSKCFYYLIDVGNGVDPDWFPEPLFKVVDRRLPKNWFMRIFSKEESDVLHSVMGFDELCNNEDFYENLFEGDEDTLLICYRRRKELEEEFSEDKDDEAYNPEWEKLK